MTMPRVGQVARDDAAPSVRRHYQRLFGERDPVAEPGTATGTTGDWWTVYANVPDQLDAMVELMRTFRAPERVVTARQRELTLVRTGFLVGSKFVYSQHVKAARNAGITDTEITLLRGGWASSDVLPPEDRALLAYVDELVRGSGRVSDETFEAIRAVLGDVGVIELTIIAGSYAMQAAMARALRLEYDDVAEHVVEVPAPSAGAAAADIMSDITR
jgi:alkylhydroperoxidase family enzyme